MNEMSKLSAALSDGMVFLAEHGDFANDIDTLLDTTSDGFARSVLGYVIANGHPTARQMAALERSASEQRRRLAAAARTALVRSKGEASLDAYPRNNYTVERGLTGLQPLPEVRCETLTLTPAALAARVDGPDLDSLLDDLGL